MIVQELSALQDHWGYLPAEELRALARRLNVPLHRIHEVASYFPRYRLTPPPAAEVKVCRDMVCHLRGAASLRRHVEGLAQEIAPGRIVVDGVSCLGRCDAAPDVVSVNGHVYWNFSGADLRERLRAAADREPLPSQHADHSSPGWRIDPYQGQPRYDAIRRFVDRPDAVLKALETSTLRGMGGAGFPTFRKWAAVRAALDDVKYVVCNADESEPGTFKDRELLRRTPHLVIEGMVLAGLVTGASRGYVYIRHEYHEEAEVLRAAIDLARAEGVCGANVLGSGMSFSLEVFVSPGGYIQGEESALLEAMEDRRGEPRNKPPFPVTHGLYGKPTLINNVETLAWVPVIVLRGGAWYRDQGVNGATGLRFVSVAGDVNRPGVYEVPFGQTVRDLVFQTAGGMREGQQLKAVAASGPSGGFWPRFVPAAHLPAPFVKDRLPPGVGRVDILDLPLDPNTAAALGGMLGAAFVVYGQRADMVEQALNCLEFFRNESCGKCVPCRLGSQHLVDLVTALRAGNAGRRELSLVGELGQTLALTSICGLGQVAANPAMSLIKHFPEEVNKYCRD
jgi:NADH:ubiquinone oxidoreductase subunit F (NADH-binding)/NADH:ubiquinone oxidoreductase subunit E